MPEDEAFDAIHALEGRICFSVMTEMLSRRDYATGELRDKLKRYGYRDQEIDACLTKAADLRFIDDNRFTGHFIEERKRRGWGEEKIEQELSLRGISIEDIPDIPMSTSPMRRIWSAPAPSLRANRCPMTGRSKSLVRHLMGKGFSYGVAAQAARRRIDDSR